MSVISIDSIELNDDYATVYAVVEDMKIKYFATLLDPPEYEPALCSSTFELGEDESLPTDEDELLNYIRSRDLDWEVVEDDYSYDDYA